MATDSNRQEQAAQRRYWRGRRTVSGQKDWWYNYWREGSLVAEGAKRSPSDCVGAERLSWLPSRWHKVLLLKLFGRETTWVAQRVYVGHGLRRGLWLHDKVVRRWSARRGFKESWNAEHAKVDAEQDAERECN